MMLQQSEATMISSELFHYYTYIQLKNVTEVSGHNHGFFQTKVTPTELINKTSSAQLCFY